MTDDVLMAEERDVQRASLYRHIDVAARHGSVSITRDKLEGWLAIIDRLSARLAAAERVCEWAQEEQSHTISSRCASRLGAREQLRAALTAWESTRGTP